MRFTAEDKTPKHYFYIPMTGEFMTTARELRASLRRAFKAVVRVEVHEHHDKYGTTRDFWTPENLDFLRDTDGYKG